MSTYSRRKWLVTTATAGAALSTFSLTGAESVEEAEMILIPAGPFLMGTSEDDVKALAWDYSCDPTWLGGESPQRSVRLAAFNMDRYPVTNRQYARFCDKASHAVPEHWRGPVPPAEILDHPVTYVNRADARAYAKWAGKRLPTEAEWEKAARGTDGLMYPWGNQFDPKACQWDHTQSQLPTGPTSVKAHPRGASPYGAMDMVGNAAEWCEDSPGPDSAFIKGGCWLTASPLNLRCAARGMSGHDNNRLAYIGFRCAKGA